jgi:hypothetical protein
MNFRNVFKFIFGLNKLNPQKARQQFLAEKKQKIFIALQTAMPSTLSI